MNPTSCSCINQQHSIFQQWTTEGLVPDTYTFHPDLQIVVHQHLTHSASVTHYCGTILDLKHRKEKTQKMYRIKNNGNQAICVIYDSESPLCPTTTDLPDLSLVELVDYLIHEVLVD